MIKQELFYKELHEAGIKLHTSQMEAVTHVEGPLVVFAGPGSGKTTVLTCRASYLMQVAGVPPRDLLIVTFTKAAAEEMQKRLATLPRIGELRARSCETGTFHSVFLRILLRTYGRVPKLLEDREQRQMLRLILREEGMEGNEEEVNDLLSKIGLCKNNLILPEQIKAKKKDNREFQKLYLRYESVKQERDRWDYDDILIECYRLLKTRADVRNEYGKRYRYILVDEFQDANYVQYAIVKMLSQSDNLCIVGDDDQSIYRFRGSRVEYLLQFQKEFPNAKKVLLEINYRSTDQIIETATKIINGNRKRQWKDLKGTGKQGEPYSLERPPDERKEAVLIVDQIQKQVQQGRNIESIAVLYRSNIQAQTLVDELVRRTLPFSVRDTEGDFYQRWQVRDILCYFSLAVNPYDADSLLQIINRPKRYIYHDDSLQELTRIVNRLDCSYLTALLRLPGLENWKVRKVEQLIWNLKKVAVMSAIEALRFVRSEIGYDQYLDEYVKQTRQNKEQVHEPLDMLQQAAAGFSNLTDFLLHVKNTNEALEQARRSNDGVQLMTFHKSKGLEFATVFVIGLVDGMMPHRKSLKDKELTDALEEERRLFYVGITRAKEQLFLFAPQNYYGSKTETSPFLKEIGHIKSKRVIAK